MAYHQGNGYSNQAYCNQYDQYDQYEYEQCNNGNILLTEEVDDFYYNNHESSFTRQPIKQREPPIGAISTVQYVEQQQQQQQQQQQCTRVIVSPQAQRRIISPNLNRRNVTSPELNRRVITTSPNLVRRDPPLSPNQHRRQTIIVSPSRPISPNYNQSRPTSPNYTVTTPRMINQIPLPPRRPLNTSYAENRQNATQLSYSYIPMTTSTPNKRYGDASSQLISTSPTRRNVFQTPMKTTAIISPNMYRKSIPSMSPKEEIESPSKASWMLPPTYQTPPRATLGTAAFLLGICGAVTCILGLYMLSLDGRKYYLDFAFLSGFSSLILGCLGFRARRWEWLPNRNYVSGYVLVALFSVMTSGCLVVMASLKPKPGTPISDLVGGAVCAISVLSLLLASIGIVTSHCCKYPPPDNRVQHCAEGFTL